jgi:AraC family transcriptional regulator
MNNTESFYIQKINLAMDYIEENFEKKITTPELARISAFSEYHFHRIFKAITGETVNRYVKRLKMAKSRRVLQLDNKPITEIALDYGYKSSANFARDFKQYFNESASHIRKHGSKGSLIPDIPVDLNLTHIGFRNYPAFKVIYKRVLTGYNPVEIQKSFQELLEWIYKNKLAFEDVRSFGIGYDDPDYIDPEKCRYDACVSLQKEIPLNVEPFNIKIIDPGKCIVFLFEGKGKDFEKSWDYVFQTVIHKEGIRPGDKPHFEEYLHSDRFNEGIFRANLCLPVLPL